MKQEINNIYLINAINITFIESCHKCLTTNSYPKILLIKLYNSAKPIKSSNHLCFILLNSIP